MAEEEVLGEEWLLHHLPRHGKSVRSIVTEMERLFLWRWRLVLSSSLLVQGNQPPAKLNLLTCQVKRNPEEKKSFDLFSRKFPGSSRRV